MSSIPPIETANKVYARVIEILTIAGLIIMIIGFILYLTGQVPVYVSLNKMAKYWGCRAKTFWKVVKGKKPSYGYGWIFENLGYADMISLLGIILLPIGVIIALFATFITYAYKRDRMLVVAVIVFIIVLIAFLGPYIGIR